jgi:hypothetical protein
MMLIILHIGIDRFCVPGPGTKISRRAKFKEQRGSNKS